MSGSLYEPIMLIGVNAVEDFRLMGARPSDTDVVDHVSIRQTKVDPLAGLTQEAFAGAQCTRLSEWRRFKGCRRVVLALHRDARTHAVTVTRCALQLKRDVGGMATELIAQ